MHVCVQKNTSSQEFQLPSLFPIHISVYLFQILDAKLGPASVEVPLRPRDRPQSTPRPEEDP